MNEVVLLFLALFTKHFIIDFIFQTKYQWSNKGTYGHPGGILHAGLHGIGTYVCFALLFPAHAILLAYLDAVVHYHIDWAKMSINKKYGLGPNTHASYWVLLGLDQYLHALTYIALIVLAI